MFHKVDHLKRKCEDIKLEIQKSLQKRYIDFVPQYVELDTLTERIDDVTEEYEDLCNYVDREVNFNLY